jgi:thiazole/oxazole-forming peptide maturase SagD family component
MRRSVSPDLDASGHSPEGRERPIATISGPILSIAEPGSPVFVGAARLTAMRAEDRAIRYASGWGSTWAEAVRRCRMEAVERCSAQFFGTEALRRATLGEVGAAAIAPCDLLLVAKAQFDGRGAWNKAHPGLTAIPSPWLRERRIDWIACDAELSSQPAWLPAGFCFLGHDRDRRSGLAPVNSSGVAAGPTPEAAAVNAFLELVERDAVAIWWYNRIRRPRFRPDSIPSDTVLAYARWTAERGRILDLHDLTHDLGLPVVAALARGRDGGRFAFGFGAATTLAEATDHAVGELAQCESNLALIERHVAERGARSLTAEARALLRWSRSPGVLTGRHLAGGPIRSPAFTAKALDLAGCRDLCRVHGLRFLAVDLTRPGIGVPVIRVAVPGLRHLWARFAPGRLYDVPVRLGWRSRPIAARRLNPIPLMI